MKLSIRRNGDEIGQTVLGGIINLPSLYVSPVTLDWTLTIPVDTETLAAGVYDVIEIEEIELEETDWDRRAKMARLSPTEFGDLLAALETDDWPDGVLPSDIEAIIGAIPDQKERELALWAFHRATYFERLNPLIDQIGAALGLSPEDIDVAWEGATA